MAVQALTGIKGTPPPVVSNAIESIVGVDRLLATTVIAESAPGPGLTMANNELAKGDADRTAGKFAMAIDHYRNAWKALRG
jgi:hypothetical protein